MCIVLILTYLNSPAERAVMALASLTAWTYVFFFLLAFRITGPMVVMIYQMVPSSGARLRLLSLDVLCFNVLTMCNAVAVVCCCVVLVL